MVFWSSWALGLVLWELNPRANPRSPSFWYLIVKPHILGKEWLLDWASLPKAAGTIFQNKKRVLLGETVEEKLPQYKNIGLGFKAPGRPLRATYIDKKCPFTGNVSIWGQILSGVVTKMKMQRTIVVRWDYLHCIQKYIRICPWTCPPASGHPDWWHCHSGGGWPLIKTASSKCSRFEHCQHEVASTKKWFQKFWDWTPAHSPSYFPYNNKNNSKYLLSHCSEGQEFGNGAGLRSFVKL